MVEVEEIKGKIFDLTQKIKEKEKVDRISDGQDAMVEVENLNHFTKSCDLTGSLFSYVRFQKAMDRVFKGKPPSRWERETQENLGPKYVNEDIGITNSLHTLITNNLKKSCKCELKMI